MTCMRLKKTVVGVGVGVDYHHPSEMAIVREKGKTAAASIPSNMDIPMNSSNGRPLPSETM